MEAEIEEILEITARLSTEIERRQANIDFARECFGHRHDDVIQYQLDAAQKDVEGLRGLVDRALEHCACTVTSQ